MTLLNFSTALLIVLGFLYWLDASDKKQRATVIGRQACEKEGLQFLDDTVVLDTLRVCRSPQGGLLFMRRYHFEFTSDGGHRYSGEIRLLGRRLQQLTLQPYRIS